jgi:small subunit ribosomal protein S18
MTTPRTTQGGSRPPFRRGGRRRRQCYCKESTVDYKDVSSIRRFITDRGRIEAGKKSGNCAKCQRNLTTAIKRARHLALLPLAPDHLRVTGAVATNNRIADDDETVHGETTESTVTEPSIDDAPAAEAESSETPVVATEDQPEAVEDSATEDQPEAVEDSATEDQPEATEEAQMEETDTATGDVSTEETAEAEKATEADASTDEEDK